MVSKRVIFGAFLFLVQSIFLYFGDVFNKTIIPFALVGYEVVITNWRYALVGYFITSYPTRANGIKCFVTPPNSNAFSDWRRTRHVPWVKSL